MTPPVRVNDTIERLVARLATSSRVAHIALAHPGEWDSCDKKRCRQDREAIVAARVGMP